MSYIMHTYNALCISNHITRKNLQNNKVMTFSYYFCCNYKLIVYTPSPYVIELVMNVFAIWVYIHIRTLICICTLHMTCVLNLQTSDLSTLLL